MKVPSKEQQELKHLATGALEHYEGVLSMLKGRVIGLLQKYAFVMFGKGLGMKMPKSSKWADGAAGGALLYSQHFQHMVVCVVKRAGAHKQRKIIKRVSAALKISKVQILEWLEQRGSR